MEDSNKAVTRPSGSPSWSASQDVVEARRKARAGFNYRAAERAAIQGYAENQELSPVEIVYLFISFFFSLSLSPLSIVLVFLVCRRVPCRERRHIRRYIRRRSRRGARRRRSLRRRLRRQDDVRHSIRLDSARIARPLSFARSSPRHGTATTLRNDRDRDRGVRHDVPCRVASRRLTLATRRLRGRGRTSTSECATSLTRT